jgi:predicted lipoprotein with Yx(FWY)xxD motif
MIWRHRAARRAVLSAALVGAALGLAACSSSPSTSTSGSATTTTRAPTTTAPPARSTTSTTGPATAPAPVYEVTTGSVDGLGTVLTDGHGLTLYLFAPDNKSGKSTCYGTCAQAWPPLLIPAGTKPVAGPGVNAALLGTTTRTDGTTEVTYNGWPLYLWVDDTAPGMATGQAINNNGGLWYVLRPDGSEVTAKPTG